MGKFLSVVGAVALVAGAAAAVLSKFYDVTVNIETKPVKDEPKEDCDTACCCEEKSEEEKPEAECECECSCGEEKKETEEKPAE